MKWTKREIIRAWLDKYIFHIPSPSACANGFRYMWDFMRAYKRGSKAVKIISYFTEDGTEIKAIRDGSVIEILESKEDKQWHT